MLFPCLSIPNQIQQSPLDYSVPASQPSLYSLNIPHLLLSQACYACCSFFLQASNLCLYIACSFISFRIDDSIHVIIQSILLNQYYYSIPFFFFWWHVQLRTRMCLSFSQHYSLFLEEYLVHSRCSEDRCWMN